LQHINIYKHIREDNESHIFYCIAFHHELTLNKNIIEGPVDTSKLFHVLKIYDEKISVFPGNLSKAKAKEFGYMGIYDQSNYDWMINQDIIRTRNSFGFSRTFRNVEQVSSEKVRDLQLLIFKGRNQNNFETNDLIIVNPDYKVSQL
jgi:hypothetical protein